MLISPSLQTKTVNVTTPIRRLLQRQPRRRAASRFGAGFGMRQGLFQPTQLARSGGEGADKGLLRRDPVGQRCGFGAVLKVALRIVRPHEPRGVVFFTSVIDRTRGRGRAVVAHHTRR